MKQFCVISAPPDTYSGYGARARDFIKAVYELKKEEWAPFLLVSLRHWFGLYDKILESKKMLSLGVNLQKRLVLEMLFTQIQQFKQRN